jgi:hypothetical protein
VHRATIYRWLDGSMSVPIVLFADVQAKLSSQAAERRCRIRGSPALLTGRLFDVQGHRMTPTHTNKNGVRYLYYVSQAALRRQSPPGSIARVPGPELEALIIDVLRRHLQGNGSDPIPETDRELIEAHLLRVTLSANEVKVHLRAAVAGSDPAIGNDEVPGGREAAHVAADFGEDHDRREDADTWYCAQKPDQFAKGHRLGPLPRTADRNAAPSIHPQSERRGIWNRSAASPATLGIATRLPASGEIDARAGGELVEARGLAPAKSGPARRSFRGCSRRRRKRLGSPSTKSR